MAAHLASFAIHVDDTDRAIAFYEAVFGWMFEPWGPPGFYLIHTGDEPAPRVQGLMHKRHEPRTGTGLNGVEPTFAVDDLDAVLAAVRANGGTVTMDKAPIPTVGVLIRFLDTEGNDIGAMAYERGISRLPATADLGEEMPADLRQLPPFAGDDTPGHLAAVQQGC